MAGNNLGGGNPPIFFLEFSYSLTTFSESGHTSKNFTATHDQGIIGNPITQSLQVGSWCNSSWNLSSIVHTAHLSESWINYRGKVWNISVILFLFGILWGRYSKVVHKKYTMFFMVLSLPKHLGECRYTSHRCFLAKFLSWILNIYKIYILYISDFVDVIKDLDSQNFYSWR